MPQLIYPKLGTFNQLQELSYASKVTCKTAMVLPLSKLFLLRCSLIRVYTYCSGIFVSILRNNMVTCLSEADHGTAIPEFVVRRFNIWLDISFLYRIGSWLFFSH